MLLFCYNAMLSMLCMSNHIHFMKKHITKCIYTMLTVRDCSPTGKVPNNEFVFKIIKFYHYVSQDFSCRQLKGMQEAGLLFESK